jgi:hypothetical protein
MIRHLVAFSFRDGVSDADRQALLDELASLPRQFPVMHRFALGANISRRDDTFAHAFSVEFEKEEDLVAYLNSQEHEDFVRLRFRPLIERRAIVSFEVP